MKYVNYTLLSASDATSQTSAKVDTDQVVSISFHCFFSDGDVAGTCQVQASNDPCPAGYIPDTFTPTNWVNVPLASGTSTAGSSVLITIPVSSYRWLRLNFSATQAGSGTIKVNVFGISV